MRHGFLLELFLEVKIAIFDANFMGKAFEL